jgi:2-haloacid dehalogenase
MAVIGEFMGRNSTYVSRRSFLGVGAAVMIGATCGETGANASSLARAAGQSKPDVDGVKALVFDTFGTVVDWRTSVAHDVDLVAKQKGFKVDAEKFADAWRAGYGPSMNRVRTGELPWTKLDDLHRMTLDKLVVDFGMASLSEAEKNALNRTWHRLKPWPDAVSGLTRLKKKFIIGPLSNGDIALMTDLAKFSGLPWDCILGAELVRHYKPDREVYQSAADFLNLKVDQVMMVAAHLGDLRGAKGVGLRTGFVPRPLEHGSGGRADLEPDDSVDVFAKDFNDLAGQLGA